MSTADYVELAEWYDRLWPRVEDVPFYTAIAARQGEPIVELCCGTGRLTWALAKTRLRIIGIDASEAMLRVAERRRPNVPESISSLATFRHASVVDLELELRPRLIIAAFSCMFEFDRSSDRIEVYRRCRSYLAPGGLFVTDNSYYGSGEFKDWGAQRIDHVVYYRGTVKSDNGNDVQHFTSDVFDSTTSKIVKSLFLDNLFVDGRVVRKTFTIQLKYVSPEETTKELTAAGFRTVDLYGGFERQRFLDPALRGHGRQVFIASP